MGERLMIRSYRRVFEVDRRIYRVDRWALPVPGGVPLRAVGYFAATLLAVIAAGSLPGVGELVAGVSAPLRFVVVPLAVAVLGTQAAPDGRVAHRFAWDWLRLRLRARRRCGGRVVPLEGEPVMWHGELALRWDCDGPQLRHGRVRGPVRVTFDVPVQLRHRGGGLVAHGRPVGEVPQSVVLCGGVVLEVRP
jgi:TcpE family